MIRSQRMNFPTSNAVKYKTNWIICEGWEWSEDIINNKIESSVVGKNDASQNNKVSEMYIWNTIETRQIAIIRSQGSRLLKKLQNLSSSRLVCSHKNTMLIRWAMKQSIKELCRQQQKAMHKTYTKFYEFHSIHVHSMERLTTYIWCLQSHWKTKYKKTYVRFPAVKDCRFQDRCRILGKLADELCYWMSTARTR